MDFITDLTEKNTTHTILYYLCDKQLQICIKYCWNGVSSNLSNNITSKYVITVDRQ